MGSIVVVGFGWVCCGGNFVGLFGVMGWLGVVLCGFILVCWGIFCGSGGNMCSKLLNWCMVCRFLFYWVWVLVIGMLISV